MDYIYIDESGDLGSDSNYLIMAVIIVDDSVKLDRIINKVRRNNKKELGNSNEIKGTETKPHIKKKILKDLNKIDYRLLQLYLTRKTNTKSIMITITTYYMILLLQNWQKNCLS